MAENRLIYLPLGGAGEIGMNCYVYGYGPVDDERFILVDVGVTFPNMDTTPGVNLIMADMSWIIERADRLEAIFITHAHEDHIGAIGLMHGKLQAPIYCRPFTAAIARLKMEDAGADENVVHEIGPTPEVVECGPFKVYFLPVAHSIPEASGLIIDTPAGRVVHTGDFKLDVEPLVGDPYDEALWGEVAKDGIQALVCDSTNVFSSAPGRSESMLCANITDLIKSAPKMVVATTFASNVARLKTLAQAGVDAGRSVVVLGRSMQRMLANAHGTGVLTDFPPTVALEDAGDIPRENLMLLVTGSQGERRAASAQLANGKYLGFTVKEGDMFLFSSKTIPGNEVGVANIINKYSALGVDVVEDEDGSYHVSGHANRPDLQTIHRLMKPKMLIPMHGEHRHLRAHAGLATEAGIASTVVPNGTMVDLTGDAPVVRQLIEAGRTYLDGDMLIGALDGVILERIKMALNGRVVVAIIFDEDDEPLGGVWVETTGLPRARTDKTLAELMEEGVEIQIARAGAKTLLSDELLERVIVQAVRKIARDLIGKKPTVEVLINRLVPA